jgi:two-component system, sensor histidine kinase RegB
LSVPIDVDAHIGLVWLIRLRWGAVACQLAALAVARSLFAMELRTPIVAALIGVTAATNIALELLFRSGRRGDRWIATVLTFDTIVLTAFLMASGGATNPFSVLYLVQVTLGAVLLPLRWTWFLVAISAGGFALLFAISDGAMHAHDRYGSHLQGMWIAYTIAAIVIAYFVGRLSLALRRRDAEVAALREEASKNARLASLTTLAAGAAHELNTPLSTVAVVAKEIQRKCEARADAQDLREDAVLIRAELERCRAILEDMSAGAGTSMGEAESALSFDQLRNLVERSLGSEGSRIQMSWSGGSIQAAPNALARVLSSLLKNALDASPPGGPVTLEVSAHPDRASFVVTDRGAGMSEETLAHAMEPFFTTKEPGRGLGLGLFLVKTFADRLGGTFRLESKRGAGTTASLEIPR